MRRFTKALLFVFVFLIPACADQNKEIGQVVYWTNSTETTIDHPPPTAPSTTTTTTTTIHHVEVVKRKSTPPTPSFHKTNTNVWDVIAQCESHGNWGAHGSYEGGLQFAPSTWTDYVAAGRSYGLVGFPAHAYDATREQQIVVAIRVRDGVSGSSSPWLNPQGWEAWPTCRHKAGV